MVTRFEKRTVAWMLAAVMCLSMVLSGKTVAYAKDNSQTDVPGGAAAESSEGTEEDVETEESVPAIAESPDYAEENKEVKTEENQETKEAEKEAKATETFGDYEYRILDGGTVEIVKYNGAGGETVIPESIDGKEVNADRVLKSIRIRLNYCLHEEIYQLRKQVEYLTKIIEGITGDGKEEK